MKDFAWFLGSISWWYILQGIRVNRFPKGVVKPQHVIHFLWGQTTSSRMYPW